MWRCRDAQQQQEAGLADVEAVLEIEPNNKEAAAMLQQLRLAAVAAEAGSSDRERQQQ